MTLDQWGRSPETREHFSECGTPYVPIDWAGPVTSCQLCGNNAPDKVRDLGPDKGKKVCEPCYQGGLEVARHRELADSAPLAPGHVRLLVENTYSDGHQSEHVVDIPGPKNRNDMQDWWAEDAFNETGDGHGVDSDLGSCYIVTIVAAEDPSLVGMSEEWTD